MGHSQLLSRVLRTVSAFMIDLRQVYNVANLIQFIDIDTPCAQYRIRSAMRRNQVNVSEGQTVRISQKKDPLLQ